MFFFIVQLYGEFADHFRLSECKLAIIHCAGHSDPILVHSLWQEIMEKGGCVLKNAALRVESFDLGRLSYMVILCLVVPGVYGYGGRPTRREEKIQTDGNQSAIAIIFHLLQG